MLTLEQKKTVVSEVADVAREAQAAVAAEYRGLTVGEMTRLRAEARSKGVYMRVVKNSLAKRALSDTGFACMNDALQGPLMLAFSREDASSAAKVIRDFAKESDKLKVKVVALNGQLLSPGDLEALARLPTRDEALSQLLWVIKAPIEKFVRTLAEPANKLARTMAAIRDQKQAAQ